jgi:hypothetical protein
MQISLSESDVDIIGEIMTKGFHRDRAKIINYTLR